MTVGCVLGWMAGALNPSWSLRRPLWPGNMKHTLSQVLLKRIPKMCLGRSLETGHEVVWQDFLSVKLSTALLRHRQSPVWRPLVLKMS